MEHISLQPQTAFQNAYKEVRVQLCELQLKMLHTDFSSDEASVLLDKLHTTLAACEQGTRREEKYILPRLKHTAAAMLADLEEEHEQEADLMARLRYLAKRWQQTNHKQDERALLFGLTDYTSFKLSHLNREERELMPILRRHFSDEELQQMQQQIMAAYQLQA